MALFQWILLAWGLARPVAAESPNVQVSDHSLSADEQYLSPYLSQLLEYNDDPIARRYILLSDFVDFDMNEFTDLIVPFVARHGVFTLPLNSSIPLSIPIPHHEIHLPIQLIIDNVSVYDLNEFKAAKPLEFDEHSKFTWNGLMSMRNCTMNFQGSFELRLWSHVVTLLDVKLTLQVINPFIDFSMMAALDRAKLCEVWGPAMKDCPLYTVFHAPASNSSATPVSGANLTRLQLNASDIVLDVEVHSKFGGRVEQMAANALLRYVNSKKPSLLKDLGTVYSEDIRRFANDAVEKEVPKMKSCVAGQDPPQRGLGAGLFGFYNVSSICVMNNGAYDVDWQYHVCPSGAEKGPGAYPVDQMRCLPLDSMDGQATKPGDAVRLGVHAVAGIHEIANPLFRYQPSSNTASFVCDGTTFLGFGCHISSLVPVDPKKPPPAKRICVLNMAGFVMSFSAKNLRTGAEQHTGNYPINQMKCVEMNSTAGTIAGDGFELDVHAVLGKNSKGDRTVVFDPECYFDVTFVCRGTTLDYSCKVMQGSTAGYHQDVPQITRHQHDVAQMII